MSEELALPEGEDKGARYAALLPQLRSLVSAEPDPLANLSNLVAALRQGLPGVSWAGLYLARGTDLVLGPFQGKIACTRIGPGKGVCGAAAARKETLIVPDVLRFPGHIACDAESRSEIVVPLLSGGVLVGVLDLDSTELATFDEVDARHLEAVAALAAPYASALLSGGPAAPGFTATPS